MEFPAAARHSRGFTLVELMIVVAIGTILLAIAVPSYVSYVRQSRRTEAKTALLDLAGREERYFSTAANGANYSATPADLGYIGAAWPIVVGSSYYQVTVCVATVAGAAPGCDPNPNAPTAPSYYVLAAPLGTQVKDLQCGSFGVDSVGNQFATGTSGSAFCWSN